MLHVHHNTGWDGLVRVCRHGLIAPNPVAERDRRHPGFDYLSDRDIRVTWFTNAQYGRSEFGSYEFRVPFGQFPDTLVDFGSWNNAPVFLAAEATLARKVAGDLGSRVMDRRAWQPGRDESGKPKRADFVACAPMVPLDDIAFCLSKDATAASAMGRFAAYLFANGDRAWLSSFSDGAQLAINLTEILSGYDFDIKASRRADLAVPDLERALEEFAASGDPSICRPRLWGFQTVARLAMEITTQIERRFDICVDREAVQVAFS